MGGWVYDDNGSVNDNNITIKDGATGFRNYWRYKCPRHRK